MDMSKVVKSIIANIEKDGKFENYEDFNKQLQAAILEYNNKVDDDFDGLSHTAMHLLLKENSSVGGNMISVNPNKLDGNEVPLIKQIRFYLSLLINAGEIKLTQTGNLPMVIVRKLCENDPNLASYLDFVGSSPIYEHHISEIPAMRYFCESTGVVKKRNNRLTLTAKGNKIMNTYQLFDTIFEVAFNRFNWAYFDRLKDEEIGMVGRNYTLYLLYKYGCEWREVIFYRDKYFKAFPHLLNNEHDHFKNYYEARTFDNILSLFGFVDLKILENKTKLVKASDLFKKYIIVKID